KKVGSLLYSIFRNLGIEDKIKLSSMQEEWHNLFTEPLSLHIYPVDMKDGELIINVDSPAWLGQLKFFKQDIIKKLHAYNINSVKFKHGRVYQKKTRNPESYSELRAKKSKPISDSDLEWIDQTISNIQDTDLKESIKKTIEKSLR
ncbi:MAG: DUF721 domain-containing protein, partial [Nitrospiraceae bacterium]|nr:DUF721 domain-containing protein [Nitrospiraceae bacterium]